MSLSVDDVCAIIRACGEAGVRRLSFDGLRLSLDKPSSEPRPPNPNPWELGPGPEAPPPSPETPAALEHSEIQKDTLEADSLALRRAQIEDLLLEDPLRAEEMITNGELGENEREGFDEDE